MHADDAAGGAGVQPHLHLHGLDADQRLALGHGVADGDLYLRHLARHRRQRARGVAARVPLGKGRHLGEHVAGDAQRQVQLAVAPHGDRLALHAAAFVAQPAVLPLQHAQRLGRAGARHLHGAAGARPHAQRAPGLAARQRQVEAVHAVGPPAGAVLQRQGGSGQRPSGLVDRRRLQQRLALRLPLVDQVGGQARLAKGRVIQQVRQKARVVAHAEQRRIGQRRAQAADGVVAVVSVHDQLGHHGVVEGRHLAAFGDAVVDAHAAVQRVLRAPPADAPGLRREAGVRVFGVQARFDGVAAEADLVLLARQRVAGGHAQLPLDQVEPGDRLRHRVLDLQPGVHFEEVVLLPGVDHELDRAGAAVAHRQRRRHRVASHGRAQRRADHRRGRFLDQLLAPPLRGAVALAQVQRVAVGVGEHLDLDVPAAFDQALQHQRAVAERALRLAPRAGQRRRQLVRRPHQPHAAAAATGHRLDQQRKAEPVGLGRQVRVVLPLAQVAGGAGHAGLGHAALGQRLVAHRRDGAGRWADEHQPGVQAGLGKGGVLAQKAVAGVQRIGAALARGGQQRVGAQVGLGGRRAADVHRLVGLPHVRCGAVGVAEHRHRAIAEPARGAHHAAGDLAAVGDQDLGKAHAATAHDGARR